MAGYWPSYFFACLWTATKSRSINSQKRTRLISSHFDRTNLVNKGFIIWLLVKFCLRDTAGSPERARWLHLARSGSQSHRAIWFILPAHWARHIISMGYWPSLFGQDGWILAKFFFCEFMDLDFVSVHKLAKKELGQYPAILTEQTWSIKDLLFGFRDNFACGMQRVVPSGQDGSILPARVANHSARFGSSCPLAELAI